MQHAKEADFLASDWLTSNGSRTFKLCSIHDQVYESTLVRTLC